MSQLTFSDLKMQCSVPGLKLRRIAASPEGVLTISRIRYDSHKDSNASLFLKLIWPNVEEPQGLTTSLQGGFVQQRLKEMAESTTSCWVIMTEASDAPAACASWQHHRGKSEKEWKDIYDERWRSGELNQALADATEGVLLLKRAKILGNQDCICMSILCFSITSQSSLRNIVFGSIIMALLSRH